MKLSPLLKRAAKIAGDGIVNVSELARRIGAPRTAIYSWKQVPPKYCALIEKATNGEITPSQLRPDIFRKDHPKGWIKRKRTKKPDEVSAQ